MDNLDVFLKDEKNFHEDFGKISVSNLEEQHCIFYTDKNGLYLFDYSENKTRCIDKHVDYIIKHLRYLTLRQVLFATTDSDLIVYDLILNKLNTVYKLPTKISTISWNPNETILIVIDTDSILHSFTFECNTSSQKFEFVPTTKASLEDAVPNSVYVGWGSHNTQFKGLKKTQEVIVDAPQEYDKPVISWRGNGEQFVVNYWKQEKRYLKVFSSSLQALYQSSSYPNLLKPTSFKGQGNFIACVAGTGNGDKPYQKVVIFEKNCLVKSEFSVPENKGEIKDVLYHPDQNLLAVYSVEDTGSGFINIYFLSNAHWYLKQQLVFPSEEEVKNFKWTNVLQKSVIKLDILTSKTLYQIVFRYVINIFPNSAIVSVIDGRHVYFVDYSSKIVPPPIFLGGGSCPFLLAETPVNQILHHPESNKFICLDSAVNQYKFQDQGEFSINKCLDIQKNCDTMEVLKPMNLYDPDNAHIIYISNFKIGENNYEFAIDRKQDLLINKSVMCNNVLSMYIYENYLLFTHASSKLYCIKLTLECANKQIWHLNDFYSREIEQGAKIVCVTKTPEIVLQLPRGNLEAITCRLISIDIVENMLAENKWKEAVHFIRKQRLNWNLLIDLNPERFLKNLKEFVEAAETVSILNQIITELSNQNCLKSMYQHCAKDNNLWQNSAFDKRIAMLEILKYIMNVDPVSNLVAIVNLQIKHFTLKDALKSVCSVFVSGEFLNMCKTAVFQILLYCNDKDVISNSFTLYNIEFMKFIYSCCSEDPRVFEPELERLKKIEDPIELRFQMNLLAKNFKGATMYLVNSTAYQENFITEFILKNQTQNVAYESVTPSNPNFKTCSKLFARHLSIKSKHDEAGFILCKAQMYSEALDEFKLALNVPRVLSLISQLKMDETENKKILSELANALVNYKRIDEALNLYEHYLQDNNKAIEVLLEQNMYQKALCMAMKYNYLDLIENKIKPGIVKYRNDLQDKITDLQKSFLSYTERLEKVRYKRLLKLKNVQSEEISDNFGDDFDTYSEYGSILSSRGSTISSNRSDMSSMSSRQRRKQEKKKLDLREGGIYEDIALIRHIYTLIMDIFACGPDVREVCLTLTDDESFKQCKGLHYILCEAENVVKVNVQKIWPEAFINGSTESADHEILALIHNREHLDEQFRKPPPAEKMDQTWKLSIF